MGRPKLKNPMVRHVDVRLTEADYKKLKRAAKDRPIAEFVRQAALDKADAGKG